MPNALISTEQLMQRLGQPNLRILDATYHVPPSPRDAKAEFIEAHVPGAVFFDIDAISDADSPLPHMLPSAEQFGAMMGALGIGDEDDIVVYDAHGLMSAARAWWMFNVFGHGRVSILNGGLPKWKAEDKPLESGIPTPKPQTFTSQYQAERVRDWKQVLQAIENNTAQVMDVRSAERFQGKQAEPRAGLRSGHMPNSLNLPWGQLLDPNTLTLLPLRQLREKFHAAGVDLDAPVIASCGSGVSACMGAFALHLLGHANWAVYDGSWAEWGGRADLPVEVN